MNLISSRASIFVLSLLLAGCIGKPANPAATQPTTVIDPAVAEPAHWLKQPATAEVTNPDFKKLWDACEAVAHDYLFKIDLRDFRRGLLKTQPMVSKQWFELWRNDAGTAKDVLEDSTGALRRTIYFQFTKNLDGSYTVAPKVLIERESRASPADLPEYDTPHALIYWYALRRDAPLEQKVAAAVERKLRT